jgi:membrane protease YdiL (CAAX protease family)
MYAYDSTRRKKGYVPQYFALVLVIGAAAYTPWVLASYSWFPDDLATVCLIIGGLSPAIAAVSLTAWLGGLSGLRSLFRGFIRKGFPKKWYLLALLAPLILCLCALVPWFILQPNALSVYTFNFVTLISFPLTLLFAFAMNMWEEIGWRGYAQSRLQTRYSVLLSSFIVGFFWAIWHWPLFVVRGSAMLNNYQNPLLFGAFTLLISVTYGWIYNGTKGSLLAVSLFHSSINTFTALLFFNSAIAYSVFPYYFGACAVLAFGLIYVFRSTLWTPAAPVQN